MPLFLKSVKELISSWMDHLSLSICILITENLERIRLSSGINKNNNNNNNNNKQPDKCSDSQGALNWKVYNSSVSYHLNCVIVTCNSPDLTVIDVSCCEQVPLNCNLLNTLHE